MLYIGKKISTYRIRNTRVHTIFMNWLTNCKCFEKWGDLAPFALRLAAGIIFVAHGWQKFGDITAVGGFFDSLGVPLPGFFAIVVTAVELVGGAALIFGLFTHWA